jgi:diguanylate cyclase
MRDEEANKMGVSDDSNQRPPISPHALSRKTLELIDGLHLTPTPHAYHVFYAYLGREDAELVKMVNVLIQNTRDLTDEMVLKIYNKFFGTTRHNSRLVTGVEDLMAAMLRVSTAVDDVIDDTADYGNKLQGASKSFDRDSITLEEVRTITSSLSDDTKQMLSTGESFKDDLNTYNAEIGNVMAELAQVKREAMTDPLTTIPNRKYFEAALQQGAAEAMESGDPLSLLMLDIDRFKDFNDTHGHRAGDGILKTVARVLVNLTKGEDTVARYGGEEFCILLPHTSLENAARLAENIRRRVENSEVRNKKTGMSFGKITVSIGAATFTFGETLSDFVDRADTALYVAKNDGRNRVAKAS